MAQELALIAGRTELDQVTGFRSGCYVEWAPSTYEDTVEVRKIRRDESEDEVLLGVVAFIKKKIVGGKVPVRKGEEVVLADLDPESLDKFPRAAIDLIFADIMEVPHADPKAEATPTSTSSTETESSEG